MLPQGRSSQYPTAWQPKLGESQFSGGQPSACTFRAATPTKPRAATNIAKATSLTDDSLIHSSLPICVGTRVVQKHARVEATVRQRPSQERIGGIDVRTTYSCASTAVKDQGE